uniref:Uncharacterized protein n=1 Tax=Myoviridae sp. ctu2j3 TaxID=2825197 RepID=A0A8S5UI85_9CAUD|nr:MAG TPA: hypothetical protein [Myoviridae sp. ctu2j3]
MGKNRSYAAGWNIPPSSIAAIFTHLTHLPHHPSHTT